MTHLPVPIKQSTPRPCVFQVVRVSGTIKKSEEEAIRRARAAILRAKKDSSMDSMVGLNAILEHPNDDAQTDKKTEQNDAVIGVEDSDDEDDDNERDSDAEG